jgi:hypothetical protein
VPFFPPGAWAEEPQEAALPMNKEEFEKLPNEKKKIVEAAYFTALRKEITPAQFFAVCRESLTPEQFKCLFSKKEQREQEDIKTEHLQDIMQYAGVDLREEAEHIAKETEGRLGFGSYGDEDSDNQMYSLLNVQPFREFIQRAAKSRSVYVSEDSFYFLFQVLKRKLLDFLEKMDDACRHRVEYSLSEYIIRINNDLSRQLWCLEQIEKMEYEKLTIRRSDEESKKKAKKTVQEREDLLIKKRLSNTVALAALGIQQKSWMNAEDTRVNEENTVFNSIYSPFDEKALERKVVGRSITMRDFVYVLERDKRYNKSIFTIQHYFK